MLEIFAEENVLICLLPPLALNNTHVWLQKIKPFKVFGLMKFLSTLNFY